MDAVGAVDAGSPRWAKHGYIPGSWTGEAVGCGIICRIGLCLDNDATDLINEQRRPNEITGDRHGISGEEQWSNTL